MALARDPDTGHLIGIEPKPVAQHPECGCDFPKWVQPHDSHITRVPGAPPVASGFVDQHIDRDGVLRVLCGNAEEEAKALADVAPAPEPHASKSKRGRSEPRDDVGGDF